MEELFTLDAAYNVQPVLKTKLITEFCRERIKELQIGEARDISPIN